MPAADTLLSVKFLGGAEIVSVCPAADALRSVLAFVGGKVLTAPAAETLEGTKDFVKGISCVLPAADAENSWMEIVTAGAWATPAAPVPVSPNDPLSAKALNGAAENGLMPNMV